ncbi:MAG TPA: hypothetical protein DEO84_02870, partial [candidate division Zixibacteria bacterium]|nr:hypothetical protein [candidate division Zixibacteria bacterium]
MNSDLSGAVLQVAAMMELAARTAPKTRGEDFIKTMIVSGERLRELSENMVKFGAVRKKGGFDRDGSNVAASSAVLLVGLKDAKAAGLNCGACGYPNCEALKEAPAVDIEF